MVTSQATDSDKNSTSQVQELVSQLFATVSIAVPDSMGDTDTSDLVLWVEVGRAKLFLRNSPVSRNSSH